MKNEWFIFWIITEILEERFSYDHDRVEWVSNLIASREKAKQKEIEGFTLGQIIKSISGRITQSVSSLLLALKAKNDTLNI